MITLREHLFSRLSVAGRLPSLLSRICFDGRVLSKDVEGVRPGTLLCNMVAGCWRVVEKFDKRGSVNLLTATSSVEGSCILCGVSN
jgi:hypothetical protein